MTAERLCVFDAHHLRASRATSRFAEGSSAGWLSCYRPARCTEISMGYWLFVIVSIGSIPLAGAMARERNRPSGKWLWIAATVGPLAPLALLILGNAKGPASVT